MWADPADCGTCRRPVGHPEAVDSDPYRRGERRPVDQPTGPLPVPVSADELADATEVADKRTLQQAYNLKHLSGGGTGKRGNLVGRLVEVKLLSHLEHAGDWEVVDTSDDEEARYRKEGDMRVDAAPGGSPVRLDAKGMRVGDWVTYGRSLYLSQCTDTRVDVIVWGTLPDDPTAATEVVLDGCCRWTKSRSEQDSPSTPRPKDPRRMIQARARTESPCRSRCVR